MAKSNSTSAKTPPPARGLTDKFLQNLKPPRERDYEDIPDKACAGLYVRSYATGKIVFRWNYVDLTTRKTRAKTYGTYGRGQHLIGLDMARTEHKKAKARHHNGEPVIAEGEIPENVHALSEIFYTRRILPHRSRPDVVRAILDNDIIPKLGTRKLYPPILPPTVAAVVESVVDRGAETHAGGVLSLMKQMFNFAMARGYIDYNPALPLDRKDLGIVDNIRNHYPNAEEIRAIWRALNLAPRLSVTISNGLKILILTLVRTGELLKARWEHVDLDKGEWFIPKENSKTTEWIVPLVPMVIPLFRQLQDIAGDSPWVMASDTSKTGRIDDKALGHAFRRLLKLTVNDPKSGEKVPLLDIRPCRVHDFRRAGRSCLDDLKMIDPETKERRSIEPHIAEKCLNHSLGRIEKTYNQNTLLKQRRAALEAWADYVDLVVHDRENVSVLGGAA